MLKRGQKWLGRFKYNTCFASLSIDATLVLEGQTFMRRSWFGNVADVSYFLTLVLCYNQIYYFQKICIT